MPLYEYRCACGAGFEQLMAVTDPVPSCPACNGSPRKLLSGFALGGRASAGLSQAEMPQTWRGTHEGNREYVTQLRRQWDKRERLEERHPELAGDRRPVLAHEGPYATTPLRAGDSPVPAATGPGHHHGTGQAHGHTHGPAPAAEQRT